MASKFTEYLMGLVPVNLIPFVGMLLRFVGVLPTSRAGLCYSVLVSLYLVFSSTPQFIDLWMRLDSLNNALANMSPTAVIFGAFLGQLLILRQHNILIPLFNEVKKDYNTFLASSQLARKRLCRSHILVITLCILVCTTMILYVLEPLLTQSNQLVLPAWYPFSVKDGVNYALVYIYQSLTVAFAGTLILSANTLFCEVNLHTIAHLEELCLSIRHAVTISNYPQGLAVESEMNRRLAWCARRHAILLRRIDHLAQVLSAASAIDYIFCMICVATLGLETITVKEDIPFIQIIKSCALLACATVTIFPPCLIAQQTVDMLEVAAATSDYYVVEAPESVKRTMQIINIRAQVPKNLTIGGLLDTNLVTYGEALKLAYGIFAMLHHFKS